MGKIAFRLVEVVLAVIALITAATNSSVQRWIDANGQVLFVVVVVVVLLAFGAIDWAITERSHRVRAQTQVESLQQAAEEPKPTERDLNLFRRVFETMPVDGSTVFLFAEAFNGKQWYEDALVPLRGIAFGMARGYFFDDPEVESARNELWLAVNELLSDMANEGFVASDPDADRTLYRLKEAHFYEGQWAEYGRVRERLVARGHKMLDAHDQLHRVGRARGL